MIDETTEPRDVPKRLVSLDALRGFDMFWIVGAESIVKALNEIGQTGVTGWFAEQFEHVRWEGFRFYDLIFPLFIFIMGISIPLSLDKLVEKEGKKAACFRVLRRGVLLYLCGFFYTDGFSRHYPEYGMFGVLQRIAFCYTIAGLLYLVVSRRVLVGIFAAILVGYWALLSFVPVPAEPELTALNPDWGAGGISLALGNNWAHYVDHHLWVHHMGSRHFYNEGLFSTLPAVCTALLGVFAGLLLRYTDIATQRKVAILFVVGAIAVVLGYLWGIQFPIIKKLWTSSYVLVAGGYSAMLLALFMQVIDIWGYARWATPFVWIGANALVLYLADRFIDFQSLAERIAGGDIAGSLGAYGQLLLTVVHIGLVLVLARFLYKQKIFIRL